jgi:hypothetical protein
MVFPVIRFGITLLFLIAIPSLFLVLTYRMGKRKPFVPAMLSVIGLAIASALVWWTVASVIAATFVNCCFRLNDKPFDYDFFFGTLGKPLSICYAFPLVQSLFGLGVCPIADIVTLPASFILLGIIVLAVIARPIRVAT